MDVVAWCDDYIETLVLTVYLGSEQDQGFGIVLIVPVNAEEASVWVIADRLQEFFLVVNDGVESAKILIRAQVVRYYFFDRLAVFDAVHAKEPLDVPRIRLQAVLLVAFETHCEPEPSLPQVVGVLTVDRCMHCVRRDDRALPRDQQDYFGSSVHQNHGPGENG